MMLADQELKRCAIGAVAKFHHEEETFSNNDFCLNSLHPLEIDISK